MVKIAYLSCAVLFGFVATSAIDASEAAAKARAAKSCGTYMYRSNGKCVDARNKASTTTAACRYIGGTACSSSPSPKKTKKK